MTKNRKIAYLALLGNMVLWGLAIPFAKRGFADGLTPSAFLLGRFALASIISLPLIAILSHRPNVQAAFKPKNILTIVLLEILGTVISLWLLYEGVARTSGVEASLIAITWPIFVVIGAVFFLKEREEKHELIGLALAIAGTVLLVLKPLVDGGISGNIIGNLLVVGQNIAISAYYLLAKRFYKHWNKWAVTHISFWTGIIGFTLIQFLQGTNPWQSFQTLLYAPSLWPLAAIVYMAIGGSILGLTLYLIGQDKIEASEAAIFTYLEPAIAIPASMLLLKESVSILEITGALIIAAGVYLVEIRPKKRYNSSITFNGGSTIDPQ